MSENEREDFRLSEKQIERGIEYNKNGADLNHTDYAIGYSDGYEARATRIQELEARVGELTEIIALVRHDTDKYESIDGPTWVKINAALSGGED